MYFRAESYFQSLFIVMDKCTGSAEAGAHHRILWKPRTISGHPIWTLATREKFKSNVQHWLNDLVDIERRPIPRDGCWIKEKGKQVCRGDSQEIRLMCSLPIMLMVETSGWEGEQPGDKDMWDFPATLDPLARQAHSDTMMYDIVGRIFHSKKKDHFRARYQLPAGLDSKCGIYEYDGMKQKGYSVRMERGTVASCLCGTDGKLRAMATKEGFRTAAVFYRLRGGYHAQRQFHQHQIQAIQKVYNLRFSCDDLNSIPRVSYGGADFTQVPNGDRFWMTDPYSGYLTDYSERLPIPRAVPEVKDSGPESEEGEEGEDDPKDKDSGAKSKEGDEEEKGPKPTGGTKRKAVDDSGNADDNGPAKKKLKRKKGATKTSSKGKRVGTSKPSSKPKQAGKQGRPSTTAAKVGLKRKIEVDSDVIEISDTDHAAATKRIKSDPATKSASRPSKADAGPRRRKHGTWDYASIHDESEKEPEPIDQPTPDGPRRGRSRNMPKTSKISVSPIPSTTFDFHMVLGSQTPGHSSPLSRVSSLEALFDKSTMESNCRCGSDRNRSKQGDLDRRDAEVRCDTCYKWSHIACQQGRLHKEPDKIADFRCDECALPADEEAEKKSV